MGVHFFENYKNHKNIENLNSLKMQIRSKTIETYDVGRGPEHMLIQNDILWISRTFYSSDWSSTYYGSSKIDLISGEITTANYGLGLICGGNILKINNEIYRTVNGGVAPLTAELDLNIPGKIGSYQNLYTATSLNNNLYLGTSDYSAPDTVNIHNDLGELINKLIVGALPGDFALWENDQS